MKKFISIMLILSTLLSLTIICNATLIEEELIDISAEEEIMPMCSSGCGYTWEKIPGVGKIKLYDDLPTLLSGQGYSYTGNSHPYTLAKGYTYSSAPGDVHDYQCISIFKKVGKKSVFVDMFYCVHI
jgi:hypothetical protein